MKKRTIASILSLALFLAFGTASWAATSNTPTKTSEPAVKGVSKEKKTKLVKKKYKQERLEKLAEKLQVDISGLPKKEAREKVKAALKQKHQEKKAKNKKRAEKVEKQDSQQK